MNSTLILITVVVLILLLILLVYKLKDFLDMRVRVYDLVLFSRMGNPSQEDISCNLKQCSSAKPLSPFCLSCVLFLLRYEEKITTSVLRVTIGKQVTLITTYAPYTRKHRQLAVKQNMLET